MKKLIGVIVFAFIAAGCSQINTGEVGIKTQFGKIINGPLHEGLYFYTWFGQNYIKYNIKNQTVMVKDIVFSKDVQQATIICSILYNLDSSKVLDLHQGTGINYRDILITHNFSDTLKTVVGKWEATDMIGNRDKLSSEIHRQIHDYLAFYGINIIKVNITNIDFKDAFENAVEEKQIAAQRALKAKNDTIRIQEEAEQKLISAKAEAESMAIRAEALSKNKGLVEFEAVQKWDGKMPIYMMGDTIPFINLNNNN